MNEELCLERHKRITEKLDEHERRINKHGERLDSLDKDSVELKTEIKNLCKQIGALTAILKWFIGLLVGSFVAFFFYGVQHNIFK